LLGNRYAGTRHQAVELGCQRVRGWGFGHVGSSQAGMQADYARGASTGYTAR
jgi:hypothetical protein